MTTPLLLKLKEIIQTQGPLTIAEYMEICLLDAEHGYYTTRQPFGTAGDFITAPEISQIFGELIGLFLAECWHKLGKPTAALVEIGPGRGTLMQDILRTTRAVPGFHDAISIHLIEASPALSKLQRQVLEPMHGNIHWHQDISTLPKLPLLLIANEWLDALPIQQFVQTHEGWKERMVGWNESLKCLQYVTSALCHPGEGRDPFQLPILKDILSSNISVDPGLRRDDSFFEHCPTAISAITRIAEHIKHHTGTALFIDYGYTEGNGDTFQAVKSHQFHNPLQDPGEADLTAHVDFSVLIEAVKASGIYSSITTQGTWLKRLGAELRTMQLCKNASPAQRESLISGLHRLISPEAMGELFKVLALSSLPQLDGF